MGTIAENIQRLKTAKTNLAVAITAKGVDVPSGSTIDAYANYVSQIEQGGSGNRLAEWLRNEISAVTSSDLAGVTAIPANFANNNKTIKSIDMPNTITTIGDSAFNNSSLESVSIPGSVTNFGPSNCFNNCYSLTAVTFNEGTTAITGSNTFTNCTGWTGNVNIPASVQNIGGFTSFKGCSGITSFTFLGTPKKVGYSSGNYASWTGCTGIEYFDFSHCISVPSLEHSNNFACLTQDYEIRVPEILYDQWIVATNWSAAGVVEHIVAVENPYQVQTISYTSTDGNPVTPYSTTGWTATYIGSTYDVDGGEMTFYGPEITSLPENAFHSRNNLQTINLPTIVTVNAGAFNFCRSLVSVDMPNVTNFAKCFYECNALTGVTIPDGVTSIPDEWCYNCYSITSLDIPTSVASIGSYAFKGCTGLTHVNLPESVITFGSNVFYGCYSLTSITLPTGLTSIPNAMFQNCSGLTAIDLTNVTTLGNDVFNGCTGIETLTIGSGLSTVGYYAFQGVAAKYIYTDSYIPVLGAAIEVEFGPNITVIPEQAFRMSKNIQSVIMSNNVTSIEKSAFTNASGLTTINLSTNLTTIGEEGFSWSGLNEITIPANVTSIGDSAFRNCTNLTSFTCLATIPPTVGILVFYDTNNVVIYVPASAVDTYKAATGWSTYANKIQAIPEE